MAQLICGGCRTLLMYTRNADTVRCSCCRTVNLVRSVNNIAHVNCGQCRTTLMYPYGAPSVKCALCNFVTNTGINTMAPTPCPVPTPNGSSYNVPSTSVSTTQPQNVTVVVENPMTVDGKGKLVSNVVVGITPGKQWRVVLAVAAYLFCVLFKNLEISDITLLLVIGYWAHLEEQRYNFSGILQRKTWMLKVELWTC